MGGGVAEINLPFDIIVVASIVSLHLLLNVVEDDHSCHEVDDLARRQEVEVAATIATTVPIAERCGVKELS